MVEFFSLVLGSVIGLTSFKAFKICYKVYPYILGSSYLDSIKKQTLKIAVISGSTDGVGKQFLRHLSTKEFYLIALGRSQNKLSLLNKQLSDNNSDNNSSEYTLSTYKIDFGQRNLPLYSKDITNITNLILRKCQESSGIKKIHIGLINCCGQAHISTFKQTSLQQIQKLNNVNLNAFHVMTKLLYESRVLMSSKQIPQQYFMINISSFVSSFPNIYSSIYSGSKSYCSNIMKALQLQSRFKQTNIKFLNVQPLYIKTKMVRFLNGWDVVQTKDVVDGTFCNLGKRKHTAGTIKHQILTQFPQVVKGIFRDRVQQAMELRKKLQNMQQKRKLQRILPSQSKKQ